MELCGARMRYTTTEKVVKSVAREDCEEKTQPFHETETTRVYIHCVVLVGILQVKAGTFSGSLYVLTITAVV